MTGARQLAYDYILPIVTGRERVLDLGAGDAPLAGLLAVKGCDVIAFDKDKEAMERGRDASGCKYALCVGDFTKPAKCFPDAVFDLVLAVYSIQHMIGGQAYVWSQIARILKPGGRLIHVGRFSPCAPELEKDRGDPLLSDNISTIQTFAMACGLEVEEFCLYRYEGEGYQQAELSDANAIVAQMRKPL